MGLDVLWSASPPGLIMGGVVQPRFRPLLRDGLTTAMVSASICLMTIALATLYVATQGYNPIVSCNTLFARASRGEHIGDQDAWDDYELLCDLGPPARPMP